MEKGRMVAKPARRIASLMLRGFGGDYGEIEVIDDQSRS